MPVSETSQSVLIISDICYDCVVNGTRVAKLCMLSLHRLLPLLGQRSGRAVARGSGPLPVARIESGRAAASRSEPRPVASIESAQAAASRSEPRPVASIESARAAASRREPRPVTSIESARAAPSIESGRPVASRSDPRPVASIKSGRAVAKRSDIRAVARSRNRGCRRAAAMRETRRKTTTREMSRRLEGIDHEVAPGAHHHRVLPDPRKSDEAPLTVQGGIGRGARSSPPVKEEEGPAMVARRLQPSREARHVIRSSSVTTRHRRAL